MTFVVVMPERAILLALQKPPQARFRAYHVVITLVCYVHVWQSEHTNHQSIQMRMQLRDGPSETTSVRCPPLIDSALLWLDL